MMPHKVPLDSLTPARIIDDKLLKRLREIHGEKLSNEDDKEQKEQADGKWKAQS